jgi:hypothetical protein
VQNRCKTLVFSAEIMSVLLSRNLSQGATVSEVSEQIIGGNLDHICSTLARLHETSSEKWIRAPNAQGSEENDLLERILSLLHFKPSANHQHNFQRKERLKFVHNRRHKNTHTHTKKYSYQVYYGSHSTNNLSISSLLWITFHKPFVHLKHLCCTAS